MNSSEIANVFKSLCDKNRVEIILLLNNGEKCACELLNDLDISQSTLSHHMKILLSCGIVEERKKKQWSFYKISNSKLEESITILKKFAGLGGHDGTNNLCD